MIDFKKEVLKRKEEIITHTKNLLRINSELTVFQSDSDMPFGQGIHDSLMYMLNLADKDGFQTLNADGYAGHIEYGDQFEYVGMMGHLDVVPAGSGWDYPPYAAEVVDNKIIARGAMDDKGPTMAAYYAMKIIKELNLPLSKRIKLILGTDEETAWRGVKYYFKLFPEQPIYGFIPDAGFPLTYAEKGILRVSIENTCSCDQLVMFQAGMVDNMVPDHCVAIISDLNQKDAFLNYLNTNNLTGEALITEFGLRLSVEGKSAHGSTPQEGVNAAFLMVKFLNEIKLSNAFIDLINMYLLDDPFGRKMGVDYHDEETGHVTINAGLFEFKDNQFMITLNPRYPNNVDSDIFINKLEGVFKAQGHKVDIRSHQKRLYIDPNSTLVKTLLSVYNKHTNQDAKPLTTGGGTYARAMENSVAFGPHFPGTESLIHQRNEYIDIDDLLNATAIYAESLYELAK